MRLFGKAEPTRLSRFVQFEGDVKVPGDLEVEGVVKGKILEAKGGVVIRAKGVAVGSLKCHALLVERGGKFSGPVAVGSVPGDLIKRLGKLWGFGK